MTTKEMIEALRSAGFSEVEVKPDGTVVGRFSQPETGPYFPQTPAWPYASVYPWWGTICDDHRITFSDGANTCVTYGKNS